MDHFEMVTKENTDGSVDVSVAYDDTFKKAVRIVYGRQRCTKKLLTNFFEKAFKVGCDKYQPKEWNEEENK